MSMCSGDLEIQSVSGRLLDQLWDISCRIVGIDPGEEGYSHIWAIQGRATQQDILFLSLTLEQGIKITLSL